MSNLINPEEDKNSRFVDFIKNIENRISSLTTLEIKTIIGDYKVEENGALKQRSDSEYSIMSSHIDLVGGDITTRISNEMLKEKYDWVRSFHAEKEKRGHEIISENIKAIVALIGLIREAKKTDA